MAEEVEMFRFIRKWQDNADEASDEVLSTHHQQEDPPDPQAKKLVGEERKGVACSLVEKYIRLQRIKPSDLVALVRPSGLIKTDELMAAYEMHLINSESKGKLSCRTRHGPRWRTNGSIDLKPTSPSDTNHLLRLLCHEIRSGTHIWSMQVVEAYFVGLGLTENSPRIDGSTGFHLSYFSDGYSVRYGSPPLVRTTGLPHYSAGSVVIFRLDLAKNRGTLSARVGAGEEFQLSDNVWGIEEGESEEEKASRSDRSFVPFAVFMRDGQGEVRFLGFDERPETDGIG
jgi:hypothetical protein